MISSGSDGNNQLNNAAPQGDCGRYSALLTAYFDGEATADEAKAARSHLAMCNSCERAWTAWGRARRMLRALPVPAAPPHLLARIVFACRIAALPRKVTRPQAIEAEFFGASHIDVHTLAELPLVGMEETALSDSNYEAPVIMPGDLPPVAPPPHLHEAILRLTIGADAQKLSKAEREDIAPLPFEAPAMLPLVVDEVRPAHAPRSSLAELASGRARALVMGPTRIKSVFAVPALAAWLMYATNFGGQLMETAQGPDEGAGAVGSTRVASRQDAASSGEKRNWLSRKFQSAFNTGNGASAVNTSAQPNVQPAQPMLLPATTINVSLPPTNVYTPTIDWQPEGLPPAPSGGQTVAAVKRAPVAATVSYQAPAQASRIRPVEPPTNVAQPTVTLASASWAARGPRTATRPPEIKTAALPATEGGEGTGENWEELRSTVDDLRVAYIGDEM